MGESWEKFEYREKLGITGIFLDNSDHQDSDATNKIIGFLRQYSSTGVMF